MDRPRHRKKTRLKATIALVCGAVLCIGGVMAYLMATDTATNKFTLADSLDIKVVEPGWDALPGTDFDAEGNAIVAGDTTTEVAYHVPDAAKNMLPTQSVAKDPAVKNNSAQAVYAFADVEIPVRNIQTANADGTLNPAAPTEVFAYVLNGNAETAPATGTWVKKARIENASDDGDITSYTYRYLYTAELAPGATSNNIFDEVSVCNFVNSSFDTADLAQQVTVTGYGVQAFAFDSPGAAYIGYFGEDKVTKDVTIQSVTIKAGSQYALTRTETMSTYGLRSGFAGSSPIVATAATDGEVSFGEVELVKDADYAVVKGDGLSADAKVLFEFATDEETVNGGPIALRNAVLPVATSSSGIFYQYSDTMKTLDFYTSNQEVPSGYSNQNNAIGETIDIWADSAGNYIAKPKDGYYKIELNENSEYAFSYLYNLQSVNLSGFDTSHVMNMSYMFRNCIKLTSLDLSSFDTANVTDMKCMFSDCGHLTSLNLSNFDTSNVIDMRWMFSDCAALTSLDLSSFDTANVTNMWRMFYRCLSLTSLDLSNFDTASVTTMSDMFSSCYALTSLNLSSFNTVNVAKMDYMFSGCSKLQSSAPSSWNVSRVTNHDEFNLEAPGVSEPTWIS